MRTIFKYVDIVTYIYEMRKNANMFNVILKT